MHGGNFLLLPINNTTIPSTSTPVCESRLHLSLCTEENLKVYAAKMGKKGASTGVSTKVQAAKEKKAVAEESKAAEARAAEEAAEAREWSKGANQRGSKRGDEAAKKQEEKASKLAAKKALQAEEAEQLSGFKSVVVSCKLGCAQSAAGVWRTEGIGFDPAAVGPTREKEREKTSHRVQYL